ncbi:coiled-coil domain-containing protein [Hymenobacter ruber]
MSDLSTGRLGVDIQPFLDQLGLGEKAANQLAQAAQAAGDATTKSFAAAAAEAVNYSNRIAAGAAEVRNAQAATKSAADEVRRLVDANRELAAAQKASTSTAEYNRLKGLIAENTQKIKEAKAAILENKAATDQERASVQAVRDARREETNQTKLVAAAARDAAAAAKQEAAAQKEAGAATASAGNSGGFLSTVLGKVAGAFAGLFAVNKLKEIGDDIIETTAEFERLGAVLTTIEGGNKELAQARFAQLRNFALTAPFEVKEVTEAYTLLRNVGINPTIQQLKQLGDLAAASGKDFDTAANGLLGATTGRFVQLKQFGITAKQQGDSVALTFRGVTTVVEKSQQAISDYIFGLGELNGVLGASDHIAATTGGKISNLKDSFTELFNTIGEGNSGVIHNFITGLTLVNNKVNDFLKSNDQRAQDAAGPSVDIFERVITERFARVAASAKAAGEDVALAVNAFAADQTKLQERLLKKAEDDLIVYNTKRAAAANVARNFPFIPTNAQDAALVQAYGGDRGQQEEVALKSVVQQRKAALGLIQQQSIAVRQAINDESELGLLAAARAKLAADEKLREENTDKTKSHALNLLIIADQKVIDDLLEKQTKARQKAALSYESQLRALLQERATLTSLAAKAAAESADDAAGKARAVFEESLRQVDAVKAKLEQRELDLRKQALKAGGSAAVGRLGEKADGTVDGVQAQQLTALRLTALDKYYTDLYKITAEREQRLFDLRADNDEKEVEAIDRKFDKLIKANTDGIERQALEEARQREQLALKAQQEQNRIQRTATLASSNAQAVGQVFGAGTGISVFEAARAEKQALLDIEKKAAEDSLNNTLNKTNKEGEIERAALRAQLARIANQQKELDAEQKRSTFSIYKLVLGENDSPALRQALDEVASSVLSSLGTITQAEQQAAATKAGTATQNINELQSSLSAEIALNREGSASNIKGLQDQIAEQKRVRKEALADQRKAAQEQVVIDTITQASSIATAAANVFAAFSAIPFVGVPLGIGAAGLLVAAFVASKAKAFQAASQIGAGANGSFFKGGLGSTGYTGDGNPHEESQALGRKDYTYHKREFIANHELTDQYYKSLFAPLHAGRPQDIDWSAPAMQQLLPDHALPGQLRQERAAHVEHSYRLSMEPLQAKFDGLESKLANIERSNQQMADKWDSHTLPDGRIALIDPTTKSIHIITQA